MTEPTPERFAALREPFPPELVGKLPKAGITLDYVGHGAVTHRLLEVDPEWSWEPMALDEKGLPLFTVDAEGNPIALWIRLTICGVTRLGCGTCNSNQFDAEKVLIGDALRNAAMRFGVALDLWIKGHAEDDERHATTGAAPRRTSEPSHPAYVERLLAAVKDLTEEQRTELRGWLAENGLPDRPAGMDEAQATATLAHVAVLAAQEPQDALGQPVGPNPPAEPSEAVEGAWQATAAWLKSLDANEYDDLLGSYELATSGSPATKLKRLTEHLHKLHVEAQVEQPSLV